ncbi:hypothetical protein [Streptomyces rubellomurinus]|uniref:LigA protein n=1 Tax=Streptomyces rubellomurinus (strain ATCC 31215) TaxID=359131 RepID=A0A0F2TB16_STRR3|nr:hypothetical protein [Streptomyces rubellomurinus]KJS59651.1 hypothetical protein VM95_25815 [Streptomyces rubellomurinus]
MPLDDRFAALLHDAAELAPDPPAAELAASARRRHLRARRRRTAVVAAATAVVALTALGTRLLPGADPGPGSTRLAPSGGWPEGITGTFMTDTLVSLLPPGQITAAGGYGTNDGAVPGLPPSAHLLYDDGQGAGMVTLSVDRVALPISETTAGTQCADPVESPTEGCERTVLPDGGIVVVDRLAPVEPMKVRKWQATYTGPDGRRLQIWEVNATSYGPPLSRPNPPLTPRQLTAAVTSNAWDPLFAPGAATTPAPGNSPEPSGPSADRIIATARALLPPGTLADPGATQHTTGRAHLSVTLDGRTSMLSVRADPRRADAASAARVRQAYEHGDGVDPAAVRTPDGTLVQVRQLHASKSGDGPVLRWIVTALHPDDTEVTVAEWNGTDEPNARPGTPALTTEQLTAIAVAAPWRH